MKGVLIIKNYDKVFIDEVLPALNKFMLSFQLTNSNVSLPIKKDELPNPDEEKILNKIFQKELEFYKSAINEYLNSQPLGFVKSSEKNLVKAIDIYGVNHKDRIKYSLYEIECFCKKISKTLKENSK